MKAPEKIYLQVCGDCEINDCDNCFFKDLEDNVTWSKDRIFPRDIEYTLTDAFIEMAERYIRSVADGLDRDDDVEAFISEFIKYMKGE